MLLLTQFLITILICLFFCYMHYKQRGGEQSPRIFLSKILRLPILFPAKQGQKLYLRLGALVNHPMSSTGLKLPKELPEYSFYTTLLYQIFQNTRSFGSQLKTPLKILRKGVFSQYQFDKKIQDEVLGAFFQYFIVAIVVWMMISSSGHYGVYRMSYSEKIALSLWQTIGLIVHIVLSYVMRVKMFAHYNEFSSSFYTLKSLSAIGISANVLIERCSFNKILEVTDKKFKFLNQQIIALVQKISSVGSKSLEEVDDLLEELDFLKTQDFNKFMKYQTGIKLVVIIIFFLSGYFYNMFRMADSLL